MNKLEVILKTPLGTLTEGTHPKRDTTSQIHNGVMSEIFHVFYYKQSNGKSPEGLLQTPDSAHPKQHLEPNWHRYDQHSCGD